MEQKHYVYSDISPNYTDTNKDTQNILYGYENIDKNGEPIPNSYEPFNRLYRNQILYGYDKVYDVVAIRQALINLFVIQKLEVPGKPQFGNPLAIHVFDLFDETVNSTIESAIINTVENYEPRVQIDDVRVQVDEELNRIIIEIDYYAIIDDKIIKDTIYIPYAHNTRSFLDARGITYI